MAFGSGRTVRNFPQVRKSAANQGKFNYRGVIGGLNASLATSEIASYRGDRQKFAGHRDRIGDRSVPISVTWYLSDMPLAALDAAVRAALVVAVRQSPRLAVSELDAAIKKYPVLADVSVGELMGHPPVGPEVTASDPAPRIVSLLKRHRRPLPARALASELALPVEVVRAALRLLLAAQTVRLVGEGRGRKYSA